MMVHTYSFVEGGTLFCWGREGRYFMPLIAIHLILIALGKVWIHINIHCRIAIYLSSLLFGGGVMVNRVGKIGGSHSTF